MAEPADGAKLGRFGLSNTPQIRSLLSEVTQHPQTSQELKDLCHQYVGQNVVPWRLVQQACNDIRRCCDQGAAQAPTSSICQCSSLVFPSPPARQRSKQLQERLAQLQDKMDQQRYAAMVADVTQLEQQAAGRMGDPFFPTTKLQLSFGVHVIVTMGTFFALGYYGGKFLFSNDAWAALLGAVGLAAGLLLETTLLILRTNMPMPLEHTYAHLLDKKWEQQQGAAAGSRSGKSKQQQAKKAGSQQQTAGNAPHKKHE